MPQPIAHAANIIPWLIWHELCSTFSQSSSRLADPFETTFDRITTQGVARQTVAIQPGHITFDANDVLDDVRQRVPWIVPRTHAAVPDR